MIKLLVNKVLGKFGMVVTKKKPKEEIPKKPKLTLTEVLNGAVKPPFDQVPFAGETLQYFVNNHDFLTVLDVGSGEGKHSDVLKKSGKMVTSIDYGKSVYFEKREDNHTCIFGDYYDYQFEQKFDAIWASHVLRTSS